MAVKIAMTTCWTLYFFFFNLIFVWNVAAAKEKSVIEYLGTVYIMPDGCPTPNCDMNDPECVRTKSALRNLYAHCIQSPEGQHVGCITDLMPDGSYLTVPVYATICSAMCYESKENMERVKKCPYPGFRKHDPILSKLF